MITEIICIALLMLVSAFFSGTETAYATSAMTRLKAYEDEHRNIFGRCSVYIKERYESTLSAILIGNNIVNNTASALATVIVIAAFGGDDSYSWISTVIMTLVVLTFGEILPKMVAKRIPETFCRISAVPIYCIFIILRPVTVLTDTVMKLLSVIWADKVSDNDAISEDDFETVIDIVEDEGVLDEEQCDLLQNALDFNEVLAYEVITPRVDMLAVDIRDSYDKNLQILLNSPYTRVPVYEDTPDKIIGILHLNKFYMALAESNGEKVHIRKLLSEPIFVHKTMSMPDVLEKMREVNRHMVVVLDEYGGTMGILTMEDVLEQLVGDIWDESDEVEEEFTVIDETHYEALGDMRIFDFFDELDIDVEHDDDDETDEFDDTNVTLGGWATECLDGEVEEGSSFDFRNLTITVLSYENNRIERLGIEVHINENEPEDTE